MASPQASYRPAPGSIPTEPGVYTFRDAHDTVIYVGKAKNLRARLANYFQDLEQLHPRTRIMVTTATQVTWTVVSSEVEALNLEYTWIKKYNPRFNVMYKDDKSYPSLAVTVKERFPRVFVYRGPQKPGVRYFGPYPKAWAIRETLDSLTKVFPVRTCTTGVFNRHAALGRPCLLGYIDKCSAPCVGNISAEDHRELVQQFMSFLGGNTASVTRNVRLEMEAAAEDLDFERAAMLRDQLSAMEKAMEKQAVVFSDSTDADVIACVADELEIAVQMFHVRRGRIHGQRGWVLEKDDRSLTETVLHLLTQFYGDQHVLQQRAQQADTALAESRAVAVIPREVLIPNELDDTHEAEEISVFQHWLTQLRGATVDVRVPQRGDKRALMETLTTNATQALARHKLQRSTDLSARSAALQELQEALGMTVSPLRIECIDISHTQGTDVVGSLVVFEDGLAKKSDYRRFHIREAVDHGRSDDVASIAEVVRRRFAHSKDRSSDHAPADPASPEVSRRFAYPPQLLLIDGGQPQVRAAAKVLEELGIDDVFVAGIAKRLEELWLPHDEYPVIIARNSPALYLVQQVRDEAHRFAITFHRQQRSKRMTHSALDDIAGLGPARRKALIAHFGSVAAVSQASIEEISKLPGFGPKLAAAVVEALNTD